jgi:hypothetical protein
MVQFIARAVGYMHKMFMELITGDDSMNLFFLCH